MLSFAEMDKYFPVGSAGMCKATKYAGEQGCSVSSDGNIIWWMRSPGATWGCAACVHYDGNVALFGNRVTNICAVRPAMWISLEDLE